MGELKSWVCPNCGAALGSIEKRNGINRLSMPERGLMVTGRAEVTCLACGATRAWYTDAEAVRRLMETRGR
jgi:hypothetical protein